MPRICRQAWPVTRRLCRRAWLAGLLVVVGVLATPPVGAQEAADASATWRVVSVERKPFTMRVNGELTGFSVDLLAALAERLDRRYTLVLEETFSAMLERVEDGAADMAVGNISITSEREATFDFSQPVFDAGLQILIPAEAGASLGVLAAIFTWEMLGWVLAAVLAIFVVANLMWYFERRDAPYFQRGYREGLWPSFWYALHVMVSGGFEEHVPRSVPARLLGIALVVCSLFLVSAFVAKIASTMTVNELRSDIEHFTDLYGKQVGTTRGSTASAFLVAKSIDHAEFDDIAALFAALEAGRLDAVVHDAPVLRYFATADGKGVSRVVGGVFKPEKYGIVLAQGSPQVEDVNRALLALRENGRYDEIYRRWFGDRDR
ncbi:MAG: transporter substrate-binding domain-containing protein [Gammaproteobacteria bacterium]|nr:transporter substrate-binding domain-containing protein [Gammaproteobacteria bacterium]